MAVKPVELRAAAVEVLEGIMVAAMLVELRAAAVEVEEESGATTWEKAVVSAVLVDGWFQAHITTSGDAVGWAS